MAANDRRRRSRLPPVAKKIGAGQLTEQIDILTSTPVAVSVTSVTRSGTTATVTTATAHGFLTGDYVLHAGAGEAEYNTEASVTVLNSTSYTFAVSGPFTAGAFDVLTFDALAFDDTTTAATGTLTATYVSDSQGGSGSGFYTLASGLFAHIEPMSAGEQLAAGGISAIGSFNCSLYYRADIKPQMRVSWRRYREPAARTYEIHSVQPNKDDPRRLLDLEIGVVEGA